MVRKKDWKKGREGADDGESDPPEPIGDPLLHAWPDARLDLHGRSVAEAETATRNFLLTQSRLGSGRIVHVVTGKGTGALFSAIGTLLERNAGAWVERWARDLQGAGYRARTR